MWSVSANSFTLSSVSPHRSEHKSPILSLTPRYLQHIQRNKREKVVVRAEAGDLSSVNS
jgi:hypothetical protein